jgi:hypothetical protein
MSSRKRNGEEKKRKGKKVFWFWHRSTLGHTPNRFSVFSEGKNCYIFFKETIFISL